MEPPPAPATSEPRESRVFSAPVSISRTIKRLYGLAKSEPIKAMDPGAVIKAALGSHSSGLEPSPDSKHKQLSSSELQPASISRAICNGVVHRRNIKVLHQLIFVSVHSCTTYYFVKELYYLLLCNIIF